MTEPIALIIGLVLTLLVYSYLVGDNPLYRIAVHVLVGVSAAYAAVIAISRVLLPVVQRLFAQPASSDGLLWLAPITLSILLFFKWFRSLTWLGNTSMGILVTTGAAVALVGAVVGTVIPQVTAFDGSSALNIILITLLAVSVLLYFQFSGKAQESDNVYRPAPWQGPVRLVGQTVLMVTFGAVFAGVFTTSLIILVERINYFVTGLSSLIGIVLS